MGIARVIRRVEIVDRPGAFAMKLDDRFTLYPYKVLHSGRPIAIGSDGHGLRLTCVKRIAHTDVESARNDRDPFGFWVSVRGDSIAIRHLHTKDKWALFRRISFENGNRRSGGQRG